jgi:uncharacterized membrane protein YfcA
MAYNLLLILIGAVIGFLSGVFGVGGSSIATPLLRLIDVSRMVALASPLPVTLPTALIGGIIYWRRGFVHIKAVAWTAVGGVPTVLVGAFLTSEVPGRILMALTGLFVIAVGARLLRNSTESKTPPPEKRDSRSLFILVGMITGIFSGLLANGGGFLLLPAYLLLFRFSPKEAAATSLVAVSLLAIPGTVAHYVMGHIDFKIAALLAAGVIPSTYAGAHIGLSLSKEKARWFFGLFLLLFGLFFLVRTLYRAEVYGWLH